MLIKSNNNNNNERAIFAVPEIPYEYLKLATVQIHTVWLAYNVIINLKGKNSGSFIFNIKLEAM